jgi:molecular chaperone GrpE (heat shock protein)
MPTRLEAKLSKWPFVAGDLLLLGAAWFIYFQSKLPMGAWQIFFVVLCVAGGAWLGIMPFLLEYRLACKLAEAEALTSVTAQIKGLEAVARQINGATNQWCGVQEQAEKTAALSKSMADRMAAEVKAFNDFMQRANEGEKATLRLEIEKFRRVENEWVQTLTRVMDHVFAVHQGALRSGQPRLIEQLTNFQNACRDTARRVGLVPFQPELSETFDPEKHQLVDVDAKPGPEAVVAETLASGYTFQGRLLRQALVRVADKKIAGAPESPEPVGQGDLPLQPAASA